MTINIGSSNPVLDNAIRAKGKVVRSGSGTHDLLHNFELYQNCWCMCSKCWFRFKTGTLGKCICPQCPCNNSL